MKIKYVGTKRKMSVRLPLDVGRAKQKTIIHFAPGDVHEFDDVTGQRLIELNQHSGSYICVDELKAVESVHVVNVEEPETVEPAASWAEPEETAVDVETPTVSPRKRGRPRRVRN